MKMTSAYANKLLTQLQDDKSFWLDKEKNSCVYTAAVDEEPNVPDYDYEEVAGKIEEIDEKICKLKHAINLANINTKVLVNGEEMTIDHILVRMAQLNKRKQTLDYMRKQPSKKREDTSYCSSMIEYQYINYDPELIRNEYERISKEIIDMQMALDKHNQTYEFGVKI